MKKVLIYSDKVRSGKTTNLFRWLANQKNVGGILQPVIDDKRFFYSIVDKTLIQLEIKIDQADKLKENELIKMGKYIFLRSGFDKAKEILFRDFEKNFDWLIIDEIGPLELNNSGLEPVISKIINGKEYFSGNILLVVRANILNNVLKHYNLEKDFEEFKLNFGL